MAAQESSLDVQILKKTNITVYVDEALPDILVCTYEYGFKIFKGVLLDSTKRNLPCGVQTLNPALVAKPDEDSLYAVNQRFSYTNPQHQQNAKKKNIHISSKYKNSKMTVRLRPRQVLCSKCKGVCNENAESVTRKRKLSDRAPSPVPIVKRSANAPVTRSAHNLELSNKRKVSSDEKLQAETQKDTQKDKENQKLAKAVSLEKMTQKLAKAAPLEKIVKVTLQEKTLKGTLQEKVGKLGPPEKAKITQQEKVTKTVPQEKVTKAALQEKGAKGALQDIVAKAAPQEKVSKAIPQEKVAKPVPQEKISKAAPQEKPVKPLPSEKNSKAIHQDKIAMALLQDKVTKLVSQEKIDTVVAPEKSCILIPQDTVVVPQEKETQKTKALPQEKESPHSAKVAQEQPTALSGIVNKLNIDNNSKKPLLAVTNLNKCGTTINTVNSAINSQFENSHSLDHSDSNTNTNSDVDVKEKSEMKQQPATLNKSIKRILRKKRSVGSMEDLWDETVFEDKSNKNNLANQNIVNADANACPSTRTIKISYGPQGEGTVLKIPAQIENLNVSDDSEENINIDDPKTKSKEVNNKAARKALKKAKKEARKKVLFSGSPMNAGNSPRYISGLSPRCNVGSGSPMYGIGNNSPRYLGTSGFDINAPRRRKHKMKHKKKHREDKERKHKEGENATTLSDEATKEQCVTQKLSINLKRLNNTYTSVFEKQEDSSSDDNSDQVPDFPPLNPPLMLRVNAKTVSSAPGVDGSRILVGDVVWGKILGFPWWPGKILTIINTDNQLPQAHVAWYGTCTSSLIQCDELSPYLENFKIRYNKKKRGPYKEAVKQATIEARENAENRLRDQITSSPARSIITVVPPALASPREIDVVS